MRRRILRVLAAAIATAVPMVALPVMASPAAAALLGTDSSYSVEYLATDPIYVSATSVIRVQAGGDTPVYGGVRNNGFRLAVTETGGTAAYELQVVPGYVRMEAGNTYDTVPYTSNQNVMFTLTTPSCSASAAKLSVLAATYDTAGALTGFAGTYEAPCLSGRLAGHIRWNDATPYAAAIAPALHYGPAAIDVARTSTVTVTVMGTAPLALSSAVLAGPTPAGFAIAVDRCAGASVEPGNSCRIDVTFTPSMRQRYAAVLQVPVVGRSYGPLQVAVTGTGEVPPAAPSDLRAYPGTDGVALTWTAPTGTTVTGYRVHRSVAGEAAVLLGSPTTREWADTTLPADTVATYTVSTYNAVGESAASVGVDASRAAPPTVGSTTVLTRQGMSGNGASETLLLPTVTRVRAAIDLTRLYGNDGSNYVMVEVGRVPGPGTYATRGWAGPGFIALKYQSCSSVEGSLVVRSVAYDTAGTLITMDASWRLDGCSGYGQHGEIRYASGAGYPALRAEDPSWFVPSLRTGTTTGPHRFTLRNVGTQAVPVHATTLTRDAVHWTVGADTCSNSVLQPAATCSVDVTFAPHANGTWGSGLRIATGTPAGEHTFALGGSSGAEPEAMVAPTGYAASSRAWVTFQRPADWGNGREQTVVVYRGTSATDLQPVQLPQYQYQLDTVYDTGLEQGRRYYYAVAARNEYGESRRSAPVAIDVPVDEVLFVSGDYPFGPLTSVPSAGGTARVLDLGDVWEPALSPDGRWLAYGVDIRVNSLWQRKIYVRQVDGAGGPKALATSTGSQFDPAWSPDGRMVVFTHYVPTTYGVTIGLATVPFAGGTVVAVPGSTGLANAVYAPDGHSFVAEYVGLDGKSWPRLVRINRDGTGRKDVPGGANGASPAVSRDGRIAFVYCPAWDKAPSAVRLLPWEGGTPTEPLGTSEERYFDDPAWSADGSEVYVSRTPVDANGYAGTPAILAFDPDNPGSVRSLALGWDPQVRTKDTAAPVIKVAAPVLLPTGSLRASFTVTDDTTAIGGITLKCAIDLDAFSTCTRSYARDGLTAGQHTLRVQAIDLAGRVTSVTHGFTVDLVSPVARMTAPTAAVTMAATVTASMSATDASGIKAYALRYRAVALNGTGSWIYPAGWQRLALGRVSLSVAPGKEYCFAGRARDAAGRWSTWTAAACTIVPLDDRSLIASAGWSRTALAAAWRGTITTATTVAREVRTPTLKAKRVGLVATLCPTCGPVDVYVNGRRTGRIDLRASTTRYARVLWLPTGGAVSGVVSLRTVSAGKRVAIDGFVADH